MVGGGIRDDGRRFADFTKSLSIYPVDISNHIFTRSIGRNLRTFGNFDRRAQ
jgi:hypothetical protein